MIRAIKCKYNVFSCDKSQHTQIHTHTHTLLILYISRNHTHSNIRLYCIIYNFEFHLQTYISRYSLIPFKFTGIANVFIVVARQKYENTLSK